MRFAISSILSAFNSNTVGSKVTDEKRFLEYLGQALEEYDFTADKVSGQHFVKMSATALETVSAGVGKRTQNADDFVVRVHRNQASIFLRRECAAPAESLAVVVYGRSAYLADPDVQKDTAESARITESDATHVVVAVLASAGPRSPLTPTRFTANLAGGNKEAALWSTDEIRSKAAEVNAYWNEWEVVAD